MIIPRSICRAIKSNQLVVFVGSGLSSKFGLPNWSSMVKTIIEESDSDQFRTLIPVLEKNVMSPIDILELLKSKHGEIKGYIKRNFHLEESSDLDLSLHKDILTLTGSQIITTNYDNAFELADDGNIVPTSYTSEFNVSEINKNETKYIFKLHGSYSEPDNCIIFKDQYKTLYDEDSAAKEKLKSIFTEKTILFLGFSFQDPDINLTFENLDKVFGHNTKHYIVTKNPEEFKKYKFLEPIIISNHDQIPKFIGECLATKETSTTDDGAFAGESITKSPTIPKITILTPNPIDLQMPTELRSLADCFKTIESDIAIGTLNIKTLESIEESSLVIIGSKVFKSKLYIEENNLRASLLSPEDICRHIPNDTIPIVFITDNEITPINHPSVNIGTLKSAIIKKFVFKALKQGKLDFVESEISVNLNKMSNNTFQTGNGIARSLYNNNRDLNIGKKSLTDIVGRIEELSVIAGKILGIGFSNKLLNIKASGGTGKTTLIKKVAYELYNRGYFKEGVNFMSCENVKSFEDFEEILVSGFNLMNILDFKNHLISNYSSNKIDLLIILDNFETVVNNLSREDLSKTVQLLKFATDYASITVTSREKISFSDDFEDVYNLTPLTTDDAFELFIKHYGSVDEYNQVRILREEILEDLLNNNPLAINLVTKSRTRLSHISLLRDQIKNHFFESINIDYSLVYSSNSDLNIERTKSIFQSINYSYTTLNSKEKVAFELLSLFPDGISLSNFKKCFTKKDSSNNISDREFRILRDKSLVEDYNGNLQLQPIIRRFSDHQFAKRSKLIRQKYCTDAYLFNSYVLKVLDQIQQKKTTSESLSLYSFYKNNLLNVLKYIPDVEISKKSRIPEKKYLLNYIYDLDTYVVSEKQIRESNEKLNVVKEYFSDLKHAEILIDVLKHNKLYYFKEFDFSYQQLEQLLKPEEMVDRVFEEEDYIENRYKSIISNIHSMEGHTMKRITSFIKNDNYSKYLDAHFFYLGITNTLSRKKNGFYYFEYELMLNRLDIDRLQAYIDSLYAEQHLEIMQSTYTLSKAKRVSKSPAIILCLGDPKFTLKDW